VIISAKKVVFPWQFRKYDADAVGSQYEARILFASFLSYEEKPRFPLPMIRYQVSTV